MTAWLNSWLLSNTARFCFSNGSAISAGSAGSPGLARNSGRGKPASVDAQADSPAAVTIANMMRIRMKPPLKITLRPSGQREHPTSPRARRQLGPCNAPRIYEHDNDLSVAYLHFSNDHWLCLRKLRCNLAWTVLR